MLIHLEKLGKTFGEKVVLHDVTASVEREDRIGIVGQNGAGKTTLLKILTGEYQDYEGEFSVTHGVTLGYLEQNAKLDATLDIYGEMRATFAPVLDAMAQMQILERRMAAQPDNADLLAQHDALQNIVDAADGYNMDVNIKKVLSGMGFAQDTWQKNIAVLSGGELTRLRLAKLLLEKPDILLLDEPTNYLDVEHITWLKRYLEEYENAFILISHDIPFLNSVVNLIYHMENKELNRYVGDYDHFQEVYAVKKAQKEAAYNRQQQEISELKDFVARNKARVATRNMAMSRQKKLDKMDVIELAKEKPKPEFHFRTARTSGRFVVTAKELVIGYEEPLSRPLTFAIERGEKIVLTGANGIGKTTLLKSILGLIRSLGGDVELGDYLEIGYFEQEMQKGNTNSCIQEIWEEFPSYTQYEVRAALAKCGLTTQHIESLVRVLSGGEQAKVRLCKLINRETNLLVLDEPTNHLDVDAKEELKNALKEYKGTVLMVCHEPEFYDGLATSVWDCSEWTTKVI